MLASDGYIRNERGENERLRMLAYTIAKPYLKDENMTAYEFMPLDGDPTQEEIQKEQQERLEREMKNAREFRERILNKHRAKKNAGL